MFQELESPYEYLELCEQIGIIGALIEEFAFIRKSIWNIQAFIMLLMFHTEPLEMVSTNLVTAVHRGRSEFIGINWNSWSSVKIVGIPLGNENNIAYTENCVFWFVFILFR